MIADAHQGGCDEAYNEAIEALKNRGGFHSH